MIRLLTAAIVFGIVSVAHADQSPFVGRMNGAMTKTMTDFHKIDSCLTSAQCEPATMSFVEYRRQLLLYKDSPRTMIRVANDIVNRMMVPQDDMAQYGVLDYWASPLESLRSLRGDCEDYVILKYALLHAAGIANSAMEMVIVREPSNHTATVHVVLSVTVNDVTYFLDNLKVGIYPANETYYQVLMQLPFTTGVRQ